MRWVDAIKKVLQDQDGSLHYIEISDEIIAKGYRGENQLGATPQSTVSACLTTDKTGSFERISPGVYRLTEKAKKGKINTSISLVESPKEIEVIEKEIEKENKFKIIKTFGMFWDREKINWSANTVLRGIQKYGAEPVNFNELRGIYLLYDGREVIYIGQAVGQGIVSRLKQHTTDRLAGRWNRFSWFGFDGVKSDGVLDESSSSITLKLSDVANALEGILIEGLEPRQNRKGGNLFGDEYLQYADQEFEIEKAQSLINSKLKAKL